VADDVCLRIGRGAAFAAVPTSPREAANPMYAFIPIRRIPIRLLWRFGGLTHAFDVAWIRVQSRAVPRRK